VQPKSDGIRINNTVNFEVRIYNNAILDPGAFSHYETDNTDRAGSDSYIFDTGRSGLFDSKNNFFNQTLSSGGFVNVAGDDFHLMPTSPLIDAGLNLWVYGVTMDLDGHTRFSGTTYDVGAYEYSILQSTGDRLFSNDFSVSSIRIDPKKNIVVDVSGGRELNIRIFVTDLLGRVLYAKEKLRIGTGNTQLFIPKVADGMVILTIQSDRLSYARKIILL
jgi:hypothetical protein